ncbi:MAG TPA: DUF2934 domain-containing protein [Steroidobacteraceae bacterium]|nr:DUF2934 domain-containing protein [Steroidobacteraceae bacterium]
MATRRPTDPNKPTPIKTVSTSRSAASSAPGAVEPKPVAAPVSVPAAPNPGVDPEKTPHRAARGKKQGLGSAAPAAGVQVSPDVRRAMIAESAYLRAERRGFAPGHEEADWLAAEAEVDALLRAEHKGGSQ